MVASIQARLYSPADLDTLDDEDNYPVARELFGDSDKRRLGMFFSGSGVDWYPRLEGPFMSLNKGQRLAGYDSAGNASTLYLDFDTTNEIRVKKRSDNSIIARFTLSGAFFVAGSSVGVYPRAGANLITNPSLMCRRSFIVGDDTKKTTLVAPNWQIWVSSVNSTVVATFDEEVPSDVGVDASLSVRVDPVSPPMNSGVRVAIFDILPYAGLQLTARVYLKGPGGDHTYVRLLNSNRLFGMSSLITGSDAFVPVDITFTVPDHTTLLGEDNFICFDLTYNQTPNATTPWKIAAPSINIGGSALEFERRSLEAEKARCACIYNEQRVLLGRKDQKLVNLDLQELVPPTFEIQNASGHSITTSNFDRQGIILTTPDTDTIVNAFEAKIAAYTMPILSESTGS